MYTVTNGHKQYVCVVIWYRQWQAVKYSFLHGGTLIDRTGSPPKSDALVIINGNNIIAAANQSEYLNHYFNHSNGKQTGVRFLNLTGKYIIPGLFDMHAHVREY